MNKEKVLAFLNITKEKNPDKSLPKICVWFNVAFSIFISAILILISHSYENYNILNILILFGFFDILFFVFLKCYKNPLWQIGLSFVVLSVITIKLFYMYGKISYLEFLKMQIPMFAWMHVLVLVFIFSVAIYFLTKIYHAYNLIKTNTLSNAKKKIEEKNRFPKWAAIFSFLGGSPMIYVRLLRDDIHSINLGIGFFLFALACIFLLLLIMLMPKCIIIIKFRAWQFFDNCKK